MKTFNKSNVLSVLSGAAFLLLQTFSATAQADYKGYWVDAVNAYQAQHTQHYQPMATYTPDYAYPVAAYDQYSYQAPLNNAYAYESVAAFDAENHGYYTN
ncbi:hypothetical protein [Thiothrix unzii]|uniref:Uncharacterized protein n=1 Tax=Thiothrix unzii TaxID=111769 RepID=A0A975F8D9_9GAMM|nr:hypothetical protein [Thiothrix unzii]QTR52948.1 hypothetical protein J9260_14745 [Thiothrix unzii]